MDKTPSTIMEMLFLGTINTILPLLLGPAFPCLIFIGRYPYFHLMVTNAPINFYIFTCNQPCVYFLLVFFLNSSWCLNGRHNIIYVANVNAMLFTFSRHFLLCFSSLIGPKKLHWIIDNDVNCKFINLIDNINVINCAR